MVSLLTTSQYQIRANATLDEGETAQVQALIDDASAEVLDVGDSTWDADSVPGVVVSVVYQMVRRAIENPHGYQSERLGDYSYVRAADGVEKSAMTMTKDEYRKVRRAAAKSNVSTVGVRRPDAYERQWVTTSLSEDDLVL